MSQGGRNHRVPRVWSNSELRKFAELFAGDVVNVSGWKDEDKEGAHYRDYFTRKRSYTITNYKTEARGFQGTPGEIFLDLEEPLDSKLAGAFDVVFNHTVLEHIYECQTAFANLCKMSRDIVLIVVPFVQPYHGDYGDFWRFSPLAVKRMYEANGLTLLHLSFNEDWFASTYIFAIGTKHPERWTEHFREPFSLKSATGSLAGALTFPPVGVAVRRLIRRLRPAGGRLES